MIVREMPYTNLHDLNIDWILKIVKDFQDRYQNLDETFQNMLQQIETAGNDAVEAIDNNEETALESIRVFLEQCIQAIDQETTSKLGDISSAGVAQVNIVNGLMTTLPQTYEDSVNQLQIINAVLNQTYNYPPLVQGHYADQNESDSKTLVADNYRVSTLLSAGCASKKIKIQVTNVAGIIRDIIYWTGWGGDAISHNVPVSTSASDEKTLYTYTFPPTATYFTIVFAYDYDMSAQLLVSDIQVSLQWQFTALESIELYERGFDVSNTNALEFVIPGNTNLTIETGTEIDEIDVAGGSKSVATSHKLKDSMARESVDDLNNVIGNKADLNTENKTTIVSAINEVNERFLVGVEQAVDTWLTENPEYTTTVQNNSLTEEKFTDELKLKTIKDYVTPEMFGAVGDGITDDTEAFEEAISDTMASLGRTGTVIIGNPQHTYRIRNLEVLNAVICYCNFTGVDRSYNGILLRSGSTLYRCTFVNFNKAITDGSNVMVHASIVNCYISHSNNGIWLDETGQYEGTAINKSANNVNIVECYINNHGSPLNEETGYPDAGTGYGLYLRGRVIGINVLHTVFELNRYTGIYFDYSPGTDVRAGLNVHDCYFERNRNSAIYLNHRASVPGFIDIKNNYFNNYDANLNTLDPDSTLYIRLIRVNTLNTIQDVFKWFASGLINAQYNDLHQVEFAIPSGDRSIQAIPLNDAAISGRYLKITYIYAPGSSALPLRFITPDALQSTILTLEEGIHEVILPYSTSYRVNRDFAENEKLTFVNIECAENF